MFDITTKTRERRFTFDNIKTDSNWNRKYTGQNITRTVDIKIHVKLDSRGILVFDGEIWDGYDKILYGQICEALLGTGLKYSAKFTGIAIPWMLYHLNNKSIGTPGQIKTLHQAAKSGEIPISKLHDLNACKACLEQHNLLEDGDDTYEQSVIFNPVPEEVLKTLGF